MQMVKNPSLPHILIRNPGLFLVWLNIFKLSKFTFTEKDYSFKANLDS